LLTGLTIAIVSVFMIILENDAFAIENSKYTNTLYEIEFDYPNIVHTSFEQRDNNMIIIPVAEKFKDSNNAKVVTCAQAIIR
jgi:hypothetical protein